MGRGFFKLQAERVSIKMGINVHGSYHNSSSVDSYQDSLSYGFVKIASDGPWIGRVLIWEFILPTAT